VSCSLLYTSLNWHHSLCGVFHPRQGISLPGSYKPGLKIRQTWIWIPSLCEQSKLGTHPVFEKTDDIEVLNSWESSQWDNVYKEVWGAVLACDKCSLNVGSYSGKIVQSFYCVVGYSFPILVVPLLSVVLEFWVSIGTQRSLGNWKNTDLPPAATSNWVTNLLWCPISLHISQWLVCLSLFNTNDPARKNCSLDGWIYTLWNHHVRTAAEICSDCDIYYQRSNSGCNVFHVHLIKCWN
jgi:hypothetical protein